MKAAIKTIKIMSDAIRFFELAEKHLIEIKSQTRVIIQISKKTKKIKNVIFAQARQRDIANYIHKNKKRAFNYYALALTDFEAVIAAHKQCDYSRIIDICNLNALVSSNTSYSSVCFWNKIEQKEEMK